MQLITRTSLIAATDGYGAKSARAAERRYLAALDMKCAAMQLAAAAREFSRRVAAALRIQAAARGWSGRRRARALRDEASRRAAERAAVEAAARAALAPWAATFRDRTRFLRLRSATPP